ncbi:MAG: DNA-binding transcriptional LysR family regulator [Candidatus Deianiraeaceae bacterium]|jgi:DNA-binding transcriptional LysR family regulator
MGNIRQINYWKLRLFCEAYICLSYTQAGENLHISQTSITKAIDDIESLVGNTLFYKQNNTIHPTKYAEDLFSQIQPHLKDIEKILISNKSTNKQVISIAASHSVCCTILPSLLEQSKFFKDDITCDIFNTDRSNAISLIRRNIVDFAIFPAFEVPKDIDIVDIVVLNCALLVHKDNPIVHKKNITKEDVFKENLIMIDDYKISENYRALFHSMYEKQKIRITNADYEMASRFVARGHGSCLFAYIPVDITNIVCIDLGDLLPKINYFVVARSQHNEIALDFVETFKKVARECTSFTS